MLAAAGLGLVAAWRRRSWAPVAFVLGSLLACAGILVVGSPWVDGKALATASAALPFAAALGGASLWLAGRRVAGGLVLAAIGAGVLWSNALAYREVNLAPAGQLAELEQFGEEIAGEGPALMTEYEPYGVRHFLREADAEGVSELRRSTIPLRSGETVEKGDSADTDELDPGALLAYRTLVLRRSPLQSRPPYPYELVSAGGSYEIWQRPAGGEAVLRGTSASTAAAIRLRFRPAPRSGDWAGWRPRAAAGWPPPGFARPIAIRERGWRPESRGAGRGRIRDLARWLDPRREPRPGRR